MTNKRYYPWREYQRDIHKIKNLIEKTLDDQPGKFALYGILRGGAIGAINLSHLFGERCELGLVKYQRYDARSADVEMIMKHKTPNIPIVIFDDLLDAGVTMKEVTKYFRETTNSPVFCFTLFGTSEEQRTTAQFLKMKSPEVWLSFPWES